MKQVAQQDSEQGRRDNESCNAKKNGLLNRWQWKGESGHRDSSENKLKPGLATCGDPVPVSCQTRTARGAMVSENAGTRVEPPCAASRSERPTTPRPATRPISCKTTMTMA